MDITERGAGQGEVREAVAEERRMGGEYTRAGACSRTTINKPSIMLN
jgi:hypothetical protein